MRTAPDRVDRHIDHQRTGRQRNRVRLCTHADGSRTRDRQFSRMMLYPLSYFN